MLSEAQLNRRGLLKLMMRIPELRERLKELSETDADVLSLCGAFEEASLALEELRRQQTGNERAAILEYENLCSEIELEVRAMCSR